MPATDSSDRDDRMLEECIDELDAAIEKLERFPLEVILYALRAHLAGLLHALAERGRLSPEGLARFSAGLTADAELIDPATDPPMGPD